MDCIWSFIFTTLKTAEEIIKPGRDQQQSTQRNYIILFNIAQTEKLTIIITLKDLENKLEKVEIKGRIETIQTTVLLKSARILRRVLEIWGDLLSPRLQLKLVGNTSSSTNNKDDDTTPPPKFSASYIFLTKMSVKAQLQLQSTWIYGDLYDWLVYYDRVIVPFKVTLEDTKFYIFISALPPKIVTKQRVKYFQKYKRLKELEVPSYEQTKLMKTAMITGHPSVYLMEMLLIANHIGISEKTLRHCLYN